MNDLGFRILPINFRPHPSIVEQFRNVVTPHISDNMTRLHAVKSDLRPFHKEGKLVGTALTVKTRPGDNLMVHKAIDIAEPGDVIVVDAGGETSNAIIGEIMMRLALKNGVCGFVIDGAIRDLGVIEQNSFPIYAKAVTNRGPYKDGPGEINVTVSIGGMVVGPGDIVVGDEDGLVVVPAKEAEQILQLAKEQEIKERHILQSIENGSMDRSWVDEMLNKKGLEVR